MPKPWGVWSWSACLSCPVVQGKPQCRETSAHCTNANVIMLGFARYFDGCVMRAVLLQEPGTQQPRARRAGACRSTASGAAGLHVLRWSCV